MVSHASTTHSAVRALVAPHQVVAELEPPCVIISPFNLGIVKWQGKKDGPGAVAAWKKLLETNPAYPEKDAVLQLMAQGQQRRSLCALSREPFPIVLWPRGRQFDERPRD
jgi:hypothetical protein